MESIIVTGGAGFIGSNFINHVVSNTNYNIIVLDKLNYASNLEYLPMDKITFIKIDLSMEYQRMQEIFKQHEVSMVINFAAESSVDKSFDNPLYFTTNNILSAQNLLEVIRTTNSLRTTQKPIKLIHISTDEVYGEQVDNNVSEQDILNPTNPYAATKASVDLIIKAYQYSYKLPIITVRANNIYGPNQYPEKIIPLTLLKVFKGEKVPIHGDGLNKRKYLYINDFIDATMLIWFNFDSLVGEIINIGCEFEISNLELVKLISKLMDKPLTIEFVKDRNFNDSRYSIDYTKLSNLGWQPKMNLEDGIYQLINSRNFISNN